MWDLYLVTDPSYQVDLPEFVARAVSGGVSVVQLRDKHADTDSFRAQAIALQQAIPHIPIFVNDRVEIAQELGLHLHIGQSDMPYEQARALLPEEQMIGLTIETMAQWRACVDLGIRLPDVIGLGPVEATATKPDAPEAIGVAGVAEIAQEARGRGVACVAIGGVDERNAKDLAPHVDGLCVVSAIMGAQDPAKAAKRLRTMFQEGK